MLGQGTVGQAGGKEATMSLSDHNKGIPATAFTHGWPTAVGDIPFPFTGVGIPADNRFLGIPGFAIQVN